MEQKQRNSDPAQPTAKDRLLPIPTVRDTLGQISRTSLWRLGHRDPTFPRPVTIGGRSLWSERKLAQWIAKKVDAAEGANL